MKIIFITAIGTDVGKTFVTCSLCQQLLRSNYKIRALKPVISGWNEMDNDCYKILKSQNLLITAENINKTSPWRFTAPLSVEMAADAENARQIELKQLLEFCMNKDLNQSLDYLIIEGVGGIMSPLNYSTTMIDIIKLLSASIILVTTSYLGSISHTLTALELCRNNNIEINDLVINQPINDNDVATLRFINSLKSFYEDRITLFPYYKNSELTANMPILNVKKN